MGLLNKVFTSFDFFSKQFSFNIGLSKSKSSFIGGVISLLVSVVSILYLYYLLNLYFSNQMDPKINVQQTVNDQLNEMALDQDSIMFEMNIQGEPTHRLYNRVGKRYLDFVLEYQQWFVDGSYVKSIINLVECKTSFQGYLLCIDPKDVKTLSNFPQAGDMNIFTLQIKPCKGSQDCASEQEIYNLIFSPTTYFTLGIKTKQYNKQSKQFESSMFAEYYYFDPNIFLFSRINLAVGCTKVVEGAIFQSSSEFCTIHEFKRSDNIYTLDKILERTGFEGYGMFLFQIDQRKFFITVQNPMITEVIAQFMRFIARSVAQADIINDVANILLKNYFKKSAVKLINIESQKSKQQIKDKDIFKLSRQINDTNFIEKQPQFFKASLIQKLIFFIKKIMRFNIKQSKNESLEYKTFERAIQEALERVNIYQLYTDVLRLKMAIKLILSKDQYAALLYCGSELVQENKISQKNECQSNKDIQNKSSQQQFFKKLNIDETVQIEQPKNLFSSSNNNNQQIEILKQQEKGNLSNKHLLSTFTKTNSPAKQDEQDMQFGFSIFASKQALQNQQGKSGVTFVASQFSKSIGDQDDNFMVPLGQESLIEVQVQEEVQKVQTIPQSEEQQSCQVNEMDNININNIQHQYLFEMDQIESNQELREKYLIEFLQRISQKHQISSVIDLNLFHNLIKEQKFNSGIE